MNNAIHVSDRKGRMRVWIVQVGEPLPTDHGNQRLHRSGQLALELAARGHEVTWWASRFRHFDKSFREVEAGPTRVNENLDIVYLPSPGYTRNVSVRRVLDHRELARQFRALRGEVRPPHVIHAGFPTIELAAEAVRYGKSRGIPVVVDVRDMWPDLFTEHLPRLLRPLGRAALYSMERQARAALRGATAVTGHTDPFVEFGLAKAGRTRLPTDESFPFAYEPIADAKQDPSADSFWDTQLRPDDDVALRVCCFANLSTARQATAFGLVLHALRALPRSAAERIEVVVCGEGQLAETLRSEARGLSNLVLPGWVAKGQIRALMARSDVGLLPYFPTVDMVRSIPNKAVEYLAGGLPVLSSITDGVLQRMLSPEGAVINYVPTPSTLCERLVELVEDPDRVARAASGARRAFARHFNARKVLPAMCEHLEMLALACTSDGNSAA